MTLAAGAGVAATAPAIVPGGFAAQRPLVEARHLVKRFPIKGGILQRTIAHVRAVDDASLEIRRGETLGLVGESGCGKTTMARLLLRLIEPTSGTIVFDGRDITRLSGSALKPFRRRMQIIFQDPYASLDPRTPIGDSIGEGLRIHDVGAPGDRRGRVARIMDMVGLQPYQARRYPHEFSGGQRQRIGIARALVLEPDLVICDEPVSALDVSIQAQVLNLLKSLQRELGLTYLFVAHNLGVVEHISDRVAVMYLGKIVEVATRDDLYRSPEHPYTQALMSAIPIPNPELRRTRIILRGDVPSPVNPPSGCHFHPRCPEAMPVCGRLEPPLIQVRPGHLAACHRRDPGFLDAVPVEQTGANGSGPTDQAVRPAGPAVGDPAAHPIGAPPERPSPPVPPSPSPQNR